jgi:hypothetical protein
MLKRRVEVHSWQTNPRVTNGKVCQAWRILSKGRLSGLRKASGWSAAEPSKTRQDSQGRATLSLHNLRQDLHRDDRNDLFPQADPEHELLETLALIAEGSRINSLSRVKGYKEDTIAQWVREAAEHAEQVEEVLMSEFKIERGQLDALWACVGNKGEKKLS